MTIHISRFEDAVEHKQRVNQLADGILGCRAKGDSSVLATAGSQREEVIIKRHEDAMINSR